MPQSCGGASTSSTSGITHSRLRKMKKDWGECMGFTCWTACGSTVPAPAAGPGTSGTLPFPFSFRLSFCSSSWPLILGSGFGPPTCSTCHTCWAVVLHLGHAQPAAPAAAPACSPCPLPFPFPLAVVAPIIYQILVGLIHFGHRHPSATALRKDFSFDLAPPGASRCCNPHHCHCCNCSCSIDSIVLTLLNRDALVTFRCSSRPRLIPCP